MSSLTAANSLFVSQTLSKLGRVDSVVPLDQQPFCSELFSRCLHENGKDSAVTASSRYLLHALEQDFTNELLTCDAVPSLAPAPTKLAKILFQDGLQDLIEVVEVPKSDWYAFSNIFLHDEGPFFEELSRKVGELLGVGDFFFQYPSSGPVLLRLVPPPVLLGGWGVFEWDCRAQPTSEASSPEEVRALTLDGKRPLRIDTLAYDVHGRKEMHPYVGALHDFLHILRLRRIPRTIRADLVAVFDAVRKMTVDVPRRAEIEEIALEGPFDDQMDRSAFSESILYERLFRQMSVYLGSETNEAVREFVKEFYERLREGLEGHPREKPILDAFAREIYRGRNSPAPRVEAVMRDMVLEETMHMRPATLLIRLLGDYEDTALWVRRADGRRQKCSTSIVSLLALGLRKNEAVTFEAQGKGAYEMLDRLDKINAGGWRSWETAASVIAPSTGDLSLEGIVACVERAMQRFDLADLCGVLDPESNRLYLGRPEWGHGGTALAANLKHVTDYGRVNFTRTDAGKIRAYFPENIPLENIGAYLTLKRILGSIIERGMK